ncbi:MAG: DUF2628 domain-containing protein [Acidiferrobacterales bacterium]|nr:DUF2628 domain-containing protein [Acidiferrobacterales bacterium]
MGEFTKYNVILSGAVMPNEDRNNVIQDLCQLFHSKPSYMEKLLAGTEVALKKEYSRPEAEKICRAIRTAGAECKMVAIEEQRLEVVDDNSSLSGLSITEFVVNCPSCNKDCDSTADSCHHCGYQFGREEDSQFSFSVHEYGEGAIKLPEIDEAPLEMAHMGSMKKFIGPNAAYYEKKFPLFNSVKHPKFRLSWHWPALFVFFYWALYRKLWAYAAINLAGIALLFAFTQPSPLWLVYSLVWPAAANFLYFIHVARHVRSVPEGISQYEKEDLLERKGGVSKAAVAGGVIAIFVLSVAARTLLLNMYEERFGYASNPNQQMRGDGTVLNVEQVSDKKIARTSSALIVLANALKVVVAGGNEKIIESTIENLVFRSENEEILDAWEKPILISKKDRTVVLLSGGPDGKPRNLDDIIQIVPY